MTSAGYKSALAKGYLPSFKHKKPCLHIVEMNFTRYYGHTTQIIAKKIPTIKFKGHKAEAPLD